MGDMYVPIETREIKSTSLEVHNDPSFPFVQQLKNKFGEWRDTFTLIAVPFRSGEEVKPKLERLEEFSGRSHIVSESRNAFWGSKQDGFYNCVTIKGNRFDYPEGIQKDRTGIYGLRIFGLLDQRYVQRIINASKLLRTGGVETERIERVIIPEEFQFGREQFSSLNEFKAKLKEDTTLNSEIEDKKKAYKFIDEFKPVILVRSLQVPERVENLLTPKNEEDFKKMMGKVFKFVNTKAAVNGEKVRFDEHDPRSVEQYFQEYFPEILARNMARMHNLGLAHGFLHPQNISLAGTFYDLDSVHGLPLGGNPIIIYDMNKDVGEIISIFSRNTKKAPGILEDSDIDYLANGEKPWNVRVFSIEGRRKFINKFYETYLDSLNLFTSVRDSREIISVLSGIQESGIYIPEEFEVESWAKKVTNQNT